MPGQTFLRQSGGQLIEARGQQTSAGAGDANKIVALDDTGKLDETLLPTGIGPEVKLLPASENLAAGDYVNVWNDAGTVRVRKADATSPGKPADGFVRAAFTSGNDATVYTDGQNDQVSGMTAGDVFLSTTAGLGTNTAPSTAGNVVQRVGTAVSATEVVFERGAPITLA